MPPISCWISFPRAGMRRGCRIRWRGSNCTISTRLDLSPRAFQEITMKYQAATEKMAAYRQQIRDLRQQLRKVQAEIEPQEVADYEFQTLKGKISLSELFGDHKDLMVVHNMGVSCPACTLWADGYNGVHQHVVSRAAFVVSSPDPPDVQQKFAASRGWVFPMVRHMGSSFAADMGYPAS